MPSPWIAETANGSPKPSRENSPCTDASAFGDSVLFATSSTGWCVRRRIAGDVDVDGVEPVLRVDDEHDHVGVAGGVLGLFARAEGDRVVGIDVEFDAAGVDAGERAAAPLGERVEAVARDAGRVLDDGEALTDQTVEERAFAHVGATDDRDGCRADAQALSFDELGI